MRFIGDTLRCVKGFPQRMAHLIKRACCQFYCTLPVWLALTQPRSQPSFFTNGSARVTEVDAEGKPNTF
ncbi:hypothetical protein NDU88_005216 [Pleurodeles waltl]|uniref:Uncharacterized protein n=1 Tax=Pleurodeles waltl TaxID=8319 RepID=A0AAV7L6W2_PLEWA|nr:hypothetical protein NDU88_005216 [Pleurodeles waltl]